MAQNPTLQQFKYLYVPADQSAPLQERMFNGSSEEELKRTLLTHFHNNSMSNGQRLDMATHLHQKSKSNIPADKSTNPGEEGAATFPPKKDDDQMAGLLAAAIDSSSYEIVPVVMPMRANKFIGTSLYIDDAGRFKELPVNSRASQLAQKDIRGDAFLLSNHDDPALDEWKRVDCSTDTFDTILKNPKPTLDTSNNSAMARATMLRENDAKVISPEAAAAGLKAKADGNAFFSSGDLKAAIQAYSSCIEATEGRADLCPNETEITGARLASVLNRSLCYGKMGDWNRAEKDAAYAVMLDGGSVKGWFRLATARTYLNDFAGAEEAIVHCEQVDDSKTAASDISQLRTQITTNKARLEAVEKKKYAKMFS